MRAPLRSLLFVPGDSERKIDKALASQADAVVLDLEDSVAPARKDYARDLVAAVLTRPMVPGTPQRWVRINPLASTDALADLAAIVRGRPAGLLLPKAEGCVDTATAGLYLDVLEVREGLPRGSLLLLPVVTETARATLLLQTYAEAKLPRLYGLTWGAEDLSASLWASTNTDDDGRLSLTYRMARSLCLLAAKACGTDAVDTVYPDFRDLDGLRRSCVASRREGFSGRFAIHPDQIAVINETFSPSPDDVAFAERVVAAFAANPDTGAVGVEGKMLDRPHLVQAQRVLAMRDAFNARG